MKKYIIDIFTILHYDLRMFFRYKSNLIWLIATPVVYVLMGLILVNVMGVDRFTEFSGGSESSALYVLLGYAVFSFSNYSWQCGQKVENEMVIGTLKTNFLLPIDRTSYIYGLCISTLCSTGIFAIIILIVSMLVSGIVLETIGWLLISLVLSLAYFMGVALIMCSMSLLYKKVGNTINLLTLILQLITGMMIPIPSLPLYMQRICYLSPTTWAIDSVRSSILGSKPLVPINYEVIFLLIGAISSNLIGNLILKKAVKKVIDNGEIEGY